MALEALAGGAPLIVADTGGLAELVGGTGSALLFEPGNAERPGRLHRAGADRPGPRRRPGRAAGSELLEATYSWDAIATRTVERLPRRPADARPTRFRSGSTDRSRSPVNSALPGPCSRKLLTPIWLSLVRNDSTNRSRSIRRPSVRARRQATVDRLLGERLRQHGAPRALGCEREGPLVQFLARDDLVGQTDPQRLVGRHLAAGDADLLGAARADQSGESLGATTAGNRAEQDLGLAEHGPLARDPVVARQRELAAATQRVAATRRRSRTAAPRPARRARWWICSVIGRASSGPPNSEMSAPAAKIRSPPVTTTAPGGSVGEIVGDLVQRGDDRARQGVHLAVVQRDDGDPVVAAFQQDHVIAHAAILPAPRADWCRHQSVRRRCRRASRRPRSTDRWTARRPPR